ncbi:hypothetical protein BD413DRAFT_644662 [Trametes elegans]|nr:hypothetical protein BD413DRAFT_644662 [Trametes elegans]
MWKRAKLYWNQAPFVPPITPVTWQELEDDRVRTHKSSLIEGLSILAYHIDNLHSITLNDLDESAPHLYLKAASTEQHRWLIVSYPFIACHAKGRALTAIAFEALSLAVGTFDETKIEDVDRKTLLTASTASQFVENKRDYEVAITGELLDARCYLHATYILCHLCSSSRKIDNFQIRLATVGDALERVVDLTRTQSVLIGEPSIWNIFWTLCSLTTNDTLLLTDALEKRIHTPPTSPVQEKFQTMQGENACAEQGIKSVDRDAHAEQDVVSVETDTPSSPVRTTADPARAQPGSSSTPAPPLPSGDRPNPTRAGPTSAPPIAPLPQPSRRAAALAGDGAPAAVDSARTVHPVEKETWDVVRRGETDRGRSSVVVTGNGVSGGREIRLFDAFDVAPARTQWKVVVEGAPIHVTEDIVRDYCVCQRLTGCTPKRPSTVQVKTSH